MCSHRKLGEIKSRLFPGALGKNVPLTDALSLDFWPPELETIHFCCSPPYLWGFIYLLLNFYWSIVALQCYVTSTVQRK